MSSDICSKLSFIQEQGMNTQAGHKNLEDTDGDLPTPLGLMNPADSLQCF